MIDDSFSGSCEFYDTDTTYLVSLGECLQKACERAQQDQLSLLVANDRSRIVEDVLRPAKWFNIKPEYLWEHLMSFATHQFDVEKRHKTVLHSQSTRKILFFTRVWADKEAQAHLAKCLVSDDYVIAEIASNEDIQVMIGTTIARFADKHCKKSVGMGSVNREIHYQAHPPIAGGCQALHAYQGCAFAASALTTQVAVRYIVSRV